MLLKFTKKGIYCPQADVFIDPWNKVDKAIITHGHSDHARPGHSSYLCTHESKPLLELRLGKRDIQGVGYGEVTTINGVRISLHPAGHILGSAQVRLEHKGEVAVITGDYKTEDDGISGAFVQLPCHILITESTFGMPVYKWKPQYHFNIEINNWWQRNSESGYASILYGYSLGKAQRLLSMLDDRIGRIYTHKAVEDINSLYRQLDVHLPTTSKLTDELSEGELKGSMLISPPSGITEDLKKKLGPCKTAFASGWMAVRGSRRRRTADSGFAISDHADWEGLNSVVFGSGAEKVFVTHGYAEVYSKWLREKGVNAQVLKTEFEGDNYE